MLKIFGSIIWEYSLILISESVYLIHMVAVQHTSLTLMDSGLRGSLHSQFLTHTQCVCFSGLLWFSDDNVKKVGTFTNILKLSCKLTTESWQKSDGLEWQRFIYAVGHHQSGKERALSVREAVIAATAWIIWRFTNRSCQDVWFSYCFPLQNL